MKTDILYVVKKEESYEDLRLSLRSVAKNCAGVGRVYIVGTIPDWVNRAEVVCVPFQDRYLRKHKNILNAIMHAVEHTEIGKEAEHGMFMLSSDDHFYVRAMDMRWGATPMWFNGAIHSRKDIERMVLNGEKVSNWVRSMAETREVLLKWNYNCLMFSQHANTWFSRELMEEQAFGDLVYAAQKGTDFGCEPSCLMGNYMLARRPEWIGSLKYRQDLKLSDDSKADVLYDVLLRSERECVSGSDVAVGGLLQSMLQKMFNERCKYEK